MNRPPHRAWLVAVVGLLLGLVYVVRSLAAVDWDPSLFAAFGEEATPTRVYAEERLGEVWLRATQGHDGKFFFVQANDPWLLEPEVNAAVLDRPAYRSQRMLYPAIAGGGGLLQPTAILWSMIAVNIASLAAGTWAVARIAEEVGGSPWWGLTFALNPGLISEIAIGGAGVLAAACAFGGILFLLRERYAPAVALLSAAVLAREAMLLVVGGCALWLFLRRERSRAVAVAAIPAVAAGMWAVYVRLRVADLIEGAQIQEIGVPFRGFVDAFSSWGNDPQSLLTGCAIMLLLAIFAVRTAVTRQLLGLAFAGFVPLAVVFTEQVWRSYFDITRAVAPVITAYLVAAFASRRQASPAR